MVFYDLFVTMDVFGVVDQQTEVAEKIDISHPCVQLCSGGEQKL